MHDYFWAEIGRLSIIGLLILGFGVTSQVWVLPLLLGLGGYIAWQLRQMYLMETWLHGRKADPHVLHGIWQEIALRMRKSRMRARRRKKRLSALLHRFYDTLEAMPYAAVLIEHDRVQWFNTAACHLLGLDPKVRKQRLKLSHLIEKAHLQDWLKAKTSTDFLETPAPPNPAKTLQLRWIALGKGQCLLLAHDISELKRIEAVRRDFIADVSHELRTPLTVIIGYLEMLAEEKWPEDVRRALQASRRQAERMQSIVADLLLLSRLELDDEKVVMDEVVDVGKMLQGLTEDARHLSGDKHHEIHLNLDERLGVLGRAHELHSAFANLIFNAVLHTPPGTPITIDWHREGEGARLIVADRGPGIPSEHLQRLTERFYRVDKSRSRARGGTGLGLSIVRHVLKRHQAQIEIESQIGQGSRFMCLFPRQQIVKLANTT